MPVRVTVQASEALERDAGAGAAPTAATIAAVRAACRLADIGAAQISITWLTDEEIAELNREYLDHEGATDVISFHLYEAGEDPVGDIYIGFEQAHRQAGAFGCPLQEELVRLAAHGTLHVLGLDHPHTGDRTDSVMWMLQEAVVSEVFA
jgi:probable rRNA maturation factor